MNKCDITKPYAFISYSHKDKDIVKEDVEYMQSQGLNIWWDEEMDSMAGEDWTRIAYEAIYNPNWVWDI